jgi:hypothetical protein
MSSISSSNVNVVRQYLSWYILLKPKLSKETIKSVQREGVVVVKKGDKCQCPNCKKKSSLDKWLK